NKKIIKDLNFSDKLPKDIKGTVVFVASREELLGFIILDDAIKKSSYKAISNLHNIGVKVAMITGDNEQVAKSVSEELKIDKYFADVLPEDKYKYIKELQEQGNTVLMVGDGINDAPALTQANAGVAIGAGTDVAVEAGDVVLTNNDPSDIEKLIKLSKKVYRKMIQNLVWALGYNIVAIPAAAGAFAAWGFFLRPEIGALVMSLSTVIVVINALTLKRINLES
ncbi:MAG: HAD-IC family P-type ATPase, partial [Candidatus Paceibacterota bacterium]